MMKTYLIKRLLLLFPTLLGISFMVFSISWIVPGGPIEQIIQNVRFGNLEGGKSMQRTQAEQNPLSPEQIEYLKQLYGFDQPFLVAFFQWLKKAVVFDFGQSYRYQEPVGDLIVERLPISLYYGFITTFLTYLICIPLGVFKAMHHQKWFDAFSSIFIFAGYALPSFVFGLLLLYFFGVKWDLFPIRGFVSDHFADLTFWQKIKDLILHSTLPILCYMIGSFAYITLLVKNSFLEVYGALFIRTAFAKGLSRKRIIFYHALKNSLIPLASTFGQVIGLVFTGSFLIESIFSINGMGLLGYQAVTERDYPIVLGTLYLSTLLYLLGNLLSDLCLAWLDPRIRFQ